MTIATLTKEIIYLVLITLKAGSMAAHRHGAEEVVLHLDLQAAGERHWAPEISKP